MTAAVKRLNHAVLYVSDVERSASFYKQAFGMEEIARERGMMAFMRAAGSENHHDLAVMQVGRDAPRPQPGSVGLYHLAWQVSTLDELGEMARRLSVMGAIVGASDHGATKSLYGKDPDGIEFEVMWLVPREEWGEYENRGVVMPLDLRRELERFGATVTA
jgi:catechol-2,3-dioxygenase